MTKPIRVKSDARKANRTLRDRPQVEKREEDSVILTPNEAPLTAAYKLDASGRMVHAKREIEATTIRGVSMVEFPCPFCGAVIDYGAINVDDREAKRIFRALKAEGYWFAPKRGHAGPVCPDPPPETSKFWRDDNLRAHWIKQCFEFRDPIRRRIEAKHAERQ